MRSKTCAQLGKSLHGSLEPTVLLAFDLAEQAKQSQHVGQNESHKTLTAVGAFVRAISPAFRPLFKAPSAAVLVRTERLRCFILPQNKGLQLLN